ncbi:hypothetical protein Fmac_016374 [Flemingia macrophylla]|uniref:Protein PHYTOCHROME KINASE SUBSTRATE 4 n=1 Tax=Flemingia macrophylla TaxID=520843 RepID=A0ABD1MHF2_9FABA
MERPIHTDLNPNSPTKDRNVSFSSPHLTHDQPNKCEPHYGGLRAQDHVVNTFDAHKYFNQVSNNDSIQKVTINRVSPLTIQDTEHHKHNPEHGDDITKSTRSFSYSVSSSLGGGNHSNMIMINSHRAHSFHASTPTQPPPNSSSKSTLNNKAGLLFHHPQKPTTTSATNPPPRTSSNLTKKLRTSLSKPFWLLRRKCPCNDRKSVQVKGNKNKNTNTKTNTPRAKTPTPQPKILSHKDSLNHKTPTPKSNKEVKSQSQSLVQFHPAMNQARRPTSEGFTFPLYFSTNSNNPTKPHHHQVLLNVVQEEEDTTPCESLHVFQPPSPPKSRAMDDDAASDASSDLFEIESFSTQNTTYPTITSSIAPCHETTDHELFFSADVGSSMWRRLRDTEVLPPL